MTAPLRKRPTRKDVATLADVSSAVVSYVVNNGPRPVSPETRKRVEEAIRTLNYRPNRLAGALRGGKGGVVGFVVPDISNPFFAALALEFEAAFAARGLVTAIGSVANDPQAEWAFTAALVDFQAAGVIFAGLQNQATVDLLNESGIRHLCIDNESVSPSTTWVGIDNAHEAQLAVEHLIGHGYERIGCLTGPAGRLTADERLRGYERALQEAGIPIDPDLVMRGEFSIATGLESAPKLLDAKADAVFVTSDIQSLGVMNGLRRHGAEIPDDVAVFGFDDSPLAQIAYPPLSLVAQPQQDIVALCTQILFGADAESTVNHLPATLRIGASCGCSD